MVRASRQVLMGAIALRRSKDTVMGGKKVVDLPEKTVHRVPVTLSGAERAVYSRWEVHGAHWACMLRTAHSVHHKTLAKGMLGEHRDSLRAERVVVGEGLLRYAACRYGWVSHPCCKMVRTLLAGTKWVKFRESYGRSGGQVYAGSCMTCFACSTNTYVPVWRDAGRGIVQDRMADGTLLQVRRTSDQLCWSAGRPLTGTAFSGADQHTHIA